MRSEALSSKVWTVATFSAAPLADQVGAFRLRRRCALKATRWSRLPIPSNICLYGIARDTDTAPCRENPRRQS